MTAVMFTKNDIMMMSKMTWRYAIVNEMNRLINWTSEYRNLLALNLLRGKMRYIMVWHEFWLSHKNWYMDHTIKVHGTETDKSELRVQTIIRLLLKSDEGLHCSPFAEWFLLSNPSLVFRCLCTDIGNGLLYVKCSNFMQLEFSQHFTPKVRTWANQCPSDCFCDICS